MHPYLKHVRHLLLLACMASTYAALASNKSDTLFTLADLKMTGYEQNLYDTLKANRDMPYYLKLALTTSGRALKSDLQTYVTTLDNFVKELKENGIEHKKKEKAIKLIYDAVQNKFLKKYELNVAFEDIFTSGNYNCVTATTLYALVLEQFNIRYEIKESVSHVFLIAYTDEKSISLESTDPQKGYLVFNDAYKQQFVAYLKQQKLVTLSEISEKGNDALFNTFYFSQTSIKLQQLIGLQLYNNAVFAVENDSVPSALVHLKKSHYLYPCERTRYLLYNCLLTIVSKADYTKPSDWENYALISRFTGNVISNQTLLAEFEIITRKLLIEKSDIQKYSNAYACISSNIADTVLKNGIALTYNQEAGRYYAVNNDFSTAYVYFEKAFRLQPDNYQIQSLFIETFMKSFEKINEDTAIARLEYINTHYQKISGKYKIKAMLMMYYLEKADECCNEQHFDDADTFLLKFEDVYEPGLSENTLSYKIGEVYTKPASFYLKNKKGVKALGYVQRGLKLAPDNNRLLRSLEMLNGNK